jgi:hypothetical protein
MNRTVFLQKQRLQKDLEGQEQCQVSHGNGCEKAFFSKPKSKM